MRNDLRTMRNVFRAMHNDFRAMHNNFRAMHNDFRRRKPLCTQRFGQIVNFIICFDFLE